MFVAFDRDVRVSLGVVTLGTPDRLRGCLEALVGHVSRHDFTVVVVVNADTADGAAAPVDAPDSVLVDPVPVNLGWPGGLHRARALTDAELLVWVQDDMTPEPGWLDALVDAADAHPGVGGFGSVRVDERGEVLLSNAGAARATGRHRAGGTTPTARAERLPAAVTTYDWVTSRGFLTRARTFDEVGGPDPRIWPLSYADKDYCTHVRCHGWDVALVPAARVRHAMLPVRPDASSASSCSAGARTAQPAVVGAADRARGPVLGVVEHPCAEWRAITAGAARGGFGAEASRMLVPLEPVAGGATAADARRRAVWQMLG